MTVETPRRCIFRDRGRSGARSPAAVADLLPKGLYGRSLLIVILPMVFLQAAVAYVFMQRHWELVTHRLSAAVARDVGAIIDLYKAYPPAPGDDRLQAISAERFHIDVALLPKGPLPPPMPKTFFARTRSADPRAARRNFTGRSAGRSGSTRSAAPA